MDDLLYIVVGSIFACHDDILYPAAKTLVGREALQRSHSLQDHTGSIGRVPGK